MSLAILHDSSLRLTEGDVARAAGDVVNDADHAEAAGGQRGAGAEDASVFGRLWSDGRGGWRRGGGNVLNAEGARLGGPFLQRENHAEFLTCSKKRVCYHGDKYKQKNMQEESDTELLWFVC